MGQSEALLAALAFAAIFLFSGRLRIHKGPWRRAAISAAAGAAIAYVFVHLLPELNDAGKAFVEATSGRDIPFAELRIYLAALAGFVFFYGMEYMVAWSHGSVSQGVRDSWKRDRLFVIHMGGFAAYAWLISYMMVRGAGRTVESIGLYAVAMGLHFSSVSHSLLREHGDRYLWPGRQMLAGAVLLGWLCGVWTELPGPTILTLLGVVSGSVIMNSMIMELPREKEGRFWPFVFGAAAYAGILVLV